MKQILIILVTICIILYSANVNAYGASKYDNEFDDTDVYDEEVDCPEGFFFQVYPHGQCYPKDPTIWRKERTTYIPYRNKYVCKPGYLNLGIDQCWTRVNSAYDELMEEENDKDNNKFDTDMDYEDDDAEEEEEFNGRKLKRCGKKCQKNKIKEQNAKKKEEQKEKKKRIEQKEKEEQKQKRIEHNEKEEQKEKRIGQKEEQKEKRIEHNEKEKEKRIQQKENEKEKRIQQKENEKEQNEKNVEEQRIKYLENSASKVDLGIQVKEYIDDKLDSLKSYDKYVCDHSGYDNQSPLCWNKHGNHWGEDNDRDGKTCVSPHGCWLLRTPGFTLNNEYKEDSNVRTVEDFKKNVLSKWNLSNKMKEELEEKLMPMVLNEGASKIFGDHVFVEPKKGEGEWFLEIIFVHSEMFRIKKVVYLKLHSKGWLLKPRACAYGSKNGGNRYCWKRGYKQDEIDIITKTLELKAFEAVKHVAPTKGGPLPCKDEFNCFCYQEKNKGIPSNCLDAMKHYFTTGRSRGYDGTCCLKGAKKEKGDSNKGITAAIYDGENEGFSGKQCNPSKGKKRYDFDDDEITVTDGCSATFICNGAPVSCNSRICPASRCMGSRGYQKCFRNVMSPDSGLSGFGSFNENIYVECARKCNAPNIPSNYDDRRRRRLGSRRLNSYAPDHPVTMCSEPRDIDRRRRLQEDSGRRQLVSHGDCLDCIRKCYGCINTCKCN